MARRTLPLPARSPRSVRAGDTARSAAAFALAACFATACSATPDPNATIITKEPSFAEFVGTDQFAPGVHTFLENQCGTLDCHGEIGRPFRIYSPNGLRMPNDAGLIPGTGTETAEEAFANFLSAIELEPEEMNQVVAGNDPPTKLLLVKKPTGLERHKGGTRILINDSQYICLTTWLTDATQGAFLSTGVPACAKAAALE